MQLYFNSLYSIIISIFGLLSFMKKSDDILIKIISSLFIVTGFGSALFHWYGSYGWALFDEIPMIMAAFMALIYLDELIYKIDQTNQINQINQINLNIIIYVFAMVFYIIINTLKSQRRNFPYYFAITIMVIIYRTYILNKTIQNSTEPTKYINKSQILSVKKSIIIIILSAIIWSITELTCDYLKDSNFKYILLIGHPMWHCLSSYGFYILIDIISDIKGIKCNNDKILTVSKKKTSKENVIDDNEIDNIIIDNAESKKKNQ
jgi:hypothetical protein